MKNISKIKGMVAVAATLFLSVNALAQKHTEVGLTGGLSAPLGNFAKGEYSDLKSGFSKTGYNLGIKGSYFFNNRVGVTLLAAHQTFGFKNAEQLAEGYKNDFDLDEATFTSDGRNQTNSLLAGPEYRLPFLGHFSLNGRILLGAAAARLAGNRVALEDVSDIYQETAKKTAFAVQPGLAIQYNLPLGLGIAAGADYFYSKPNFTVENQNRNNAAGRELTSYNQPFQSINLNLSLSYRF
ncbi:MAG: outer membrane beta-barrel protein [Edaphocola sp.]